MSQQSLTLNNSLGIHFRSNLNKIISALASNNSGSTAPTDTVAYMTWINSSNNEINIRNSTNTSWVKCGKVESGFGNSGSWEYVSSHNLSLTGWPSANTSPVSIDISSLENTDQITFNLELAGTVTASSTTLRKYKTTTPQDNFNVGYLKGTTAYDANIVEILNEFRSSAPSVTYNSSLDFNLVSGNNTPEGITFANNKFYVVNGYNNYKVYIYNSNGTYNSFFNLDNNNKGSSGIIFKDNRIYVSDSGKQKFFAYYTNGTRNASSDFNLETANNSPFGITYTNYNYYVVDTSSDKVYIYNSYNAYEGSFNLVNENNSPRGITFANDRLYVIDFNDKVYGYTLKGDHDSDSDFNLASGNNNPEGITFANNKLYVVNTFADDKVYVYELGKLPEIVKLKINTRNSSDTANTINGYLESNSSISSHSLTTAKVHVYKWSLATS